MGKVDELRTRQDEIKARRKEIDAEYEGVALPDLVRQEWEELTTEERENGLLIEELEYRAEMVAGAAEDEKRTERPTFQTRRPSAVSGNDIYDLSTVRANYDEPDKLATELRSRAMHSVNDSVFPHPDVDQAKQKEHVEWLMSNARQKNPGGVARHILKTGSPAYKRAFQKYCRGQYRTSEEERALALGAGGTGGFAVVYTLDPTVVPTSNFSINPYRAMARVQPLEGTNEWKAITSGAITAAYSAEATQSSDNAPTLAQPDIIVEKAQAFVPYSIEVGEDWGDLGAEMAALLQDAKDDLEATKFTTGAGHGSNEPKGIITAATNTTTAGGVAAFAIADLYKVFEALPPRFRPRAQWLGNLFTYDKVRQFDTAGGSGVWVDADGVANVRGLGPGVGGEGLGSNAVMLQPALLGRAAWEATAMASALTTGSKILVVGDWRYFVIVDRIGMNVEFIQNLVGANQRPTGQRGLYAYWRNSSDVLSAAAFQVLVTG